MPKTPSEPPVTKAFRASNMRANIESPPSRSQSAMVNEGSPLRTGDKAISNWIYTILIARLRSGHKSLFKPYFQLLDAGTDVTYPLCRDVRASKFTCKKPFGSFSLLFVVLTADRRWGQLLGPQAPASIALAPNTGLGNFPYLYVRRCIT